MKALIVGFGSIGKRHFEILTSIDSFSSVDIVSRQNLDGKRVYAELKEVPLSDYDYFVLASETHKHLEQLLFIDSRVKGKKILVEKPIAVKCSDFKLSGNNKICVGYNLRFEPAVLKLKNLLEEESVIFGSVQVGQYLPDWRPGSDYTQSYSAKEEKGGGVLLDLSHEIDYLLWFLGDVNEFSGSCFKVSDLEIETEDSAFLCLNFKCGAIVSVTMDYLSRTPIRRLYFHQQTRTILCDLVDKIIIVKKSTGEKETFNFPQVRNVAYEAMHRDFLFSENSKAALLEDGFSVVRIIQEVKKNFKGSIRYGK